MSGLYHVGELAVQRRLGQAEIAQQMARMIRSDVPPQAAAFLAEQSMLVVAAADDAGRVWTSLVTGPPGFAHADSAQTIAVEALPVCGDPLIPALRSRRRVGMIVLAPQKRRRMRVNGISTPVDDGMSIRTEQVYSNCSKHIWRRHIERVRVGDALRQVEHAHTLNGRQCKAIAAADTFFIGSADAQANADASHRGGRPGFLQVLSSTRLRWPDYRGNSMFGTLGNIHDNPPCGLLILDWDDGTTLQLTGTAEIIWDDVTFTSDAQCWIDFTVTEVVETTNASPLRWTTVESSAV